MESNRKGNWLKLWYKEPADSWVKALPLGNGRLGAMVYGGIETEILQLNEDTLWSGFPKSSYNYNTVNYLPRVRQMIFEGKCREAQAIIEGNMLGTWNQSYLPMGNLILNFNETGNIADYRRELDLETATVGITYSREGTKFERETFISAVDQVLIYRISSDAPGKINLCATMDSQLHSIVAPYASNALILKGECPVNVVPHYLESDHPIIYNDDNGKQGMKFEVILKAITKGGIVETSGGSIKIEDANSVILFLSAATSFCGFDKDPVFDCKDYEALCLSQIDKALTKSYHQLRKEHIEDYAGLLNRLAINLGDIDQSDLPTDVRLEKSKSGSDDPQLAAILFQYGRYLLISSSRPGTQPANLQGIWNQELRPYWSCNWTTNINAQMNYWPVEVCNLAECHEPLFDLIDGLSVNGHQVAEIHYGCRGWTTHHNVDIWRSAIPAGGWVNYGWAGCCFWPMGGAWLSRHLWEHYAFGMDQEFLSKRAYPVMKEAALFCLDWLVSDKGGNLVTNPSTSPENAYLTCDNQKCNVSYGSTMDMSIIWDLFTHCIACCKLLGIDDEFRIQLENAVNRLLPLKIGKSGQLQEWVEDFEDFEPGHRHLSHLYGLYPGDRIFQDKKPELMQACRKSIEKRVQNGSGQTGWSLAWLINLNARLGDAEAAYQCVKKLLAQSVYPNLFDLHPSLSATEKGVFQIDGNFGAAAGIAEMLLQSNIDEIRLLPALPQEWPNGWVKGLRARGGYEVDMQWQNGNLTAATIRSTREGICKISYGTFLTQIKVASGKIYKVNHQLEHMI